MEKTSIENTSSIGSIIFFGDGNDKQFNEKKLKERALTGLIRANLHKLRLKQNKDDDGVELTKQQLDALGIFILPKIDSFCDDLKVMGVDTKTSVVEKMRAAVSVSIRKTYKDCEMSWIVSLDCTLKAVVIACSEEIKLYRTSVDLRF